MAIADESERRLGRIRGLAGRPTAQSLVPLAGRVEVAPDESVPWPARPMLVAEILSVYLRVRWLTWRRDIRGAVSTIRSTPAGRPAGPTPGSLEAQLIAVRLGGAVRRTLRVLPTDSRCLVQALVLSGLLASRGISSTLVIGARPQPWFTAHAWVEHEGQPVLPPRGFGELRLVKI
jgi:hypothetical protein